MDGVGIAGRCGTTASPESVTLAVGETLTVSATITVSGGLSPLQGHYLFAVENDGGQFASDSAPNWGGGWNHTVGSTSGYTKNNMTTSVFTDTVVGIQTSTANDLIN